jgi:hypothetical protein
MNECIMHVWIWQIKAQTTINAENNVPLRTSRRVIISTVPGTKRATYSTVGPTYLHTGGEFLSSGLPSGGLWAVAVASTRRHVDVLICFQHYTFKIMVQSTK